MSGTWKFKWNEDNPDFIMSDYDDTGWELFNVPDNWNYRTKTSFGFCWLRLKLKLPLHSSLGLFCHTSLTSCAFYVNGQKIEEIGKAGNSRGTSIPRDMPIIIPLPPNTTDCVVAWKISNYSFFFGGPAFSPQLGPLKQLLQRIWVKNLFRFIILGIILLMSCYHFILWLERRNDKANFYLFVLCILCFLHYLNVETEIIFPLSIPSINALRIKLECISVGWLLPCILLYLNSLYQTDRPIANKKIIACAIALVAMETLFVIIFPPRVFSSIFIVNHVMLLLWAVYVFYLLFAAYIDKRKNSFPLFAVGIVLMAVILYDLLIFYIKSLPTNQFISQYGFFIFLLLQSVLISKRFSGAFKKAEYLSHNLKQEVERQTVQLSTQKKELEYTNNKLKELDGYKTEFFQNITHELRTPLTLILGPVDTIIKGGGASLSSIIRENLHTIKRNARQMLDLVNQILDLSKLDAGRMRLSLEKIDVISLCKSVYRSFNSLAESKTITYKIQTPENVVYVYSDRNKILRVLSNLLSNAFKFTAKGGEIIVEIIFPFVPEQSIGNNSELVRIAVKDTGIGIPENELPHIFERFRQVDGSTSRQFGGTGIGLALAKEYMDILEGELNVQSTPGVGSVFTILLPTKMERYPNECSVPGVREDQLPIMPVQANPGLQASAGIVDCIVLNSHQTGKDLLYTDSAYDPGKKTVFVLEDNEELLLYLKKNLESSYNVFAAMDGRQGLGKIKKLPQLPDLIISDIMMPVMDGFDFCRNLTANDEFKHIPIIFLTAKTDERLRALSLGAVDYICKPFDVDELIHKIESLLNLQVYQDKKLTNKIQGKISAVFKQESGISPADSLFEEKCRQYNITEREKQVIRLIQRGYVDKQIASELFLSKYTINAHLKNIYKKCSTNSRIELINKFSQN